MGKGENNEGHMPDSWNHSPFPCVCASDVVACVNKDVVACVNKDVVACVNKEWLLDNAELCSVAVFSLFMCVCMRACVCFVCLCVCVCVCVCVCLCVCVCVFFVCVLNVCLCIFYVYVYMFMFGLLIGWKVSCLRRYCHSNSVIVIICERKW